jgi:hypothetical protein
MKSLEVPMKRRRRQKALWAAASQDPFMYVDADVGFNGNHKMAHDQNIHIRKHLKTLFTSQI